MEIVLALGAVVVVLCFFMLIRNEIVFNVQGKAIAYIFKQDNWQELQYMYDSVSYDKMLWQFNKWTYKQFYPDFN